MIVKLLQNIFHLCYCLAMDRISDAKKIIEAMGDTAAVAELCEVSLSCVSMWKVRGIPAPQYRWMKARRPSVFRRLIEAEAV